MARDEIARKVELGWLAAFYGGLLTDKEREALRLYCDEDMSLAEIAQSTAVSRQGVHETIARAEGKLAAMEDKLRLAERFRRMEEGLLRCREALRAGRAEEAETTLDALIRLEQEENNGL